MKIGSDPIAAPLRRHAGGVHPVAAETTCTPLPGIEAVVARPELKFLLIGEYHGTVEMAGIAGDAFCAAAVTGRPAILGIEFPPENQPILDAYLAFDGGCRIARSAGVAGGGWPGDRGDLALIERARRFARAGRQISVVAFDRIPTPSVSPEREAGLAAGLVNAQVRVPNSLAFARTGGRYHGCHAPNADRSRGCTAYDMPPREPVRPRGITLDPSLRGGSDGIYPAGSVYTASAPARPSSR